MISWLKSLLHNSLSQNIRELTAELRVANRENELLWKVLQRHIEQETAEMKAAAIRSAGLPEAPSYQSSRESRDEDLL